MIQVPPKGLYGFLATTNDRQESLRVLPDVYGTADERIGFLKDFLPVGCLLAKCCNLVNQKKKGTWEIKQKIQKN